MSYNPKLFECAQYALGLSKQAFVSPLQDPSQMGGAPPGGAPPGMPPGGMPPGMPPGGMPPGMPMDPSQGGGGVPPSPPGPSPVPPGAAPASGGEPPPPSPSPAPSSGGTDPEMLRMMIREELANSGGGGKPKGEGKVPKFDPAQTHAEVVKMKRILIHLMSVNGVDVPATLLDDAPQVEAKPAEGAAGGGSPAPESQPPQSSIAPVQPIQGAMPAMSQAQPQAKAAHSVVDSAAAILTLLGVGA